MAEEKKSGTTRGQRVLGELLLREKVISPEAMRRAQQGMVEKGIGFGEALTKIGGVKSAILLEYLSQTYGFPAVSIGDLEISDATRKLITRDLIVRHRMVPVSVDDTRKRITMAFCDPEQIKNAMDDLKFNIGFEIDPVLAPENEVDAVIDKFYREDTVTDLAAIFSEEEVKILREEAVNVSELEREASQPDIIKLVNAILIDAIRRGASDIHFEAFEEVFRVRYRLDGVLQVVIRPPYKFKDPIVSRIKIMSEMKIDEKRLPQDGRIQLEFGNRRKVDFRVSVLPCANSENAVLRILEQTALQLDMSKLGLDEEQQKIFQKAVFAPWGMILITGPTGSGKTTTLYSALAALNTTDKKIMTAEDPVEILMEGVNQVQINDAIGLNFAAVLRSFLRQDPDVMMVGEIRDFETAEMAIKSAQTGHLVLSTLHTNDAASTISRLTQIGIEPYLITSSVILVAAQRLVRRVCTNCRVAQDIPAEALMELGLAEDKVRDAAVYHGVGCRQCSGSGYKGRIAVYELLPVTDDLEQCILQGSSSAELKKEAMRLGMRTLRDSALDKMLRGQTSFEEVKRVTRK
jgi:type IV pilus assembly protein PilB